MKAIIATEGQGEFSAFKVLFGSVPTPGGAVTTTVLRVACQPDGPIPGIAKACEPLLKQAKARNVDLFVVVLDREQQKPEPARLASELKLALGRLASWPFKIEVVYKNRAFENWLIADLDALRSQPARYEVSPALVRKVEPDKADRVPALDLLKRAAKGKQYDKIADGKRIVERMSITSAARHSRSLRHLLHVLGHLDYQSQCRLPTDSAG